MLYSQFVTKLAVRSFRTTIRHAQWCDLTKSSIKYRWYDRNDVKLLAVRKLSTPWTFRNNDKLTALWCCNGTALCTSKTRLDKHHAQSDCVPKTANGTQVRDARQDTGSGLLPWKWNQNISKSIAEAVILTESYTDQSKMRLELTLISQRKHDK